MGSCPDRTLHNPAENVELVRFEKMAPAGGVRGGVFASGCLERYDSRVNLVQQWEACGDNDDDEEDDDDRVKVFECRETLRQERGVLWETCYEYDNPVELLVEFRHDAHREQRDDCRGVKTLGGSPV